MERMLRRCAQSGHRTEPLSVDGGVKVLALSADAPAGAAPAATVGASTNASTSAGSSTGAGNTVDKPPLLAVGAKDAKHAPGRLPDSRVPQQVPSSAAGDAPPPDDETVARWIQERRMDKFG